MEQKIQVLLRTFEGEYRYPNGLLADAADYIDSLEDAVDNLAKEYHEAIKEPMYSGTREDWRHRAQAAEARVDALEREIEQLQAERLRVIKNLNTVVTRGAD